MPGDFSGSERDNTIHCWESDENCVASNASPGTKQRKFELLYQEEVESRGFVWNGDSSNLSSHDELPNCHTLSELPPLRLIVCTSMSIYELRALSQALLQEHMLLPATGAASTTSLFTVASASSLPALMLRTTPCDSLWEHSPSCPDNASTQAPSDDEMDNGMVCVELWVRNTFLEYHVSRAMARSRADSAPAGTEYRSSVSDAPCEETLQSLGLS